MSEYKRTDVHSTLFGWNSNLTKLLLLHYYRTTLHTINHDDYYEKDFVMNKLLPDDDVDDSNEETAGKKSSGGENKNSNVLVSKSTRTAEDNGGLHAIRTKKEGNLIPQGTTLHDDSVVLRKPTLPPLVLYIP